jgi:hypothetical protein
VDDPSAPLTYFVENTSEKKTTVTNSKHDTMFLKRFNPVLSLKGVTPRKPVFILSSIVLLNNPLRETAGGSQSTFWLKYHNKLYHAGNHDGRIEDNIKRDFGHLSGYMGAWTWEEKLQGSFLICEN